MSTCARHHIASMRVATRRVIKTSTRNIANFYAELSDKEIRHAQALRLLHERREQLCAKESDTNGHERYRGGPHVPQWRVEARPPIIDEAGYERAYLYRPDGQPSASSPVVDCSQWSAVSEKLQRRIIESAVSHLKESGYVVLEHLFDADHLLAVGEEFRHYKRSSPEGVTFSRMRAQRDMTIPPFESPIAKDWLIRHPLILALLARHLRNSLDTRDEGRIQMELVNWIASGAPIEKFVQGDLSGGFPVLDLMTVVDTPPGAAAQTRHRDTILPGPCASLGVHIPLTPMHIEPLNGPIGFTPGSHRSFGDGAKKKDVVGAVPLGSAILYDSFTEHHGLENTSSNPRAALFAWYRVPGVNSGHSDENFGAQGLDLTMRFRRYVQERLVKVIDRERRYCPSSAILHGSSNLGFSSTSALAEWGESRVCFSCNTTTGNGAYYEKRWFCQSCWIASNQAGREAPEPAADNIQSPFPDDNILSEEWLLEQESLGMNIRPSRGRHKLTLLRERGVFLPIDPSREWLSGISTEPQPELWKNALRDGAKRRLNPSLARLDGF